MDWCCWPCKKPKPGAPTDQNGGKPAPAAEPLSPDLWDRAFKALQKDEHNARLLKSYEEILRKNTGGSNTTALATVGSSTRQQQMSLVVKKKLEEMDEAEWKFHVGGKKIVVRKQIDRLVKGVLFAKDFVSAGVSLSSDPHAGLAWAGVCMLLPLLLNPSTEYQALLKGLDCISNIICQFTVLERLYRQQGLWKDLDDIEVVTNFEANVTKLYSHVLVYQAKVVCRSTLTVVEIARDALKLDDWENLLSEIESSETTCKGFMGVMDSAKLSRGFEDMDLHQEELLKLFASQGKKFDLVLTEVKALRIEQKESRKNDKESEFLKSLYASISENGSSGTGLDYESNKNINPEPVPGTCKWFLEDGRYQSWLQEKGSRILWVSAGPGCGKSVLSRLLVDKFKSTYSKDSHTICYFFFKDISEKRRSIASALCAILHQLFTNRTSLLEHAMDEFRDKGPAFATDFGILWKIFAKVAADPNSGEIICVLDALDECERSRQDGQDGQAMLIRKLTELYSEPGSNDMASMKLKIMVTSRPYFQIERSFSHLTRDLPTIRFDDDEEMKKLTADIDLVIKDRVSGMLWLTEHVKEALVHRLTSTENRTYLWVHLIFPSIENSIQKEERELLKLISTIPSTVEDAYEKILKQSPDAKKAKKLLHIVVAAVRPLTLTEMHIAMAIEDDKMSEEELSRKLDEDNNFPSTVTNLCGLFVRIEHQNIYLVHQTAKDFLQAPLKPTLGRKTDIPSDLAAWKHSLEPRESHLTLVKICISYLLFALESDPLIIDDGAENKEVRKEVGQYLKQHYFLDYSAKYWATHFRGANSEPALLESVMNLCDTQSQRFLTWFQVYWTTQYSPCPKQLTQILVGSYFGLVTLVQRLLKSESIDPDSKDDNDRTPLSWAAGKGHKAVVEFLLEAEGVNLDSTDRSCRTPLSWAVGNGQESVVPLLLKKGADLRIRDKKGRAALHWAVDNGQESIIRLLLEKADNMAAKNESGRTKLYSTTNVGYKELVQKLLDYGINFTMILKVERGDEVVVGLLLDAGADIELKDDQGKTILLQAARGGFEAVARFLLQKGADIKAKDEDGMTVVHHATINGGNESLLRLLLEKGADFKAKDINGKTALHVAAEYGDAVAARFLVGLQDLKVHEKDMFGQTPLSIAAVKGNEDIAQLLLRQDGVDPESEDASGRTALLCAASGWMLEKGGFGGTKSVVSYDKWGPVVRLLLGRDDVKPNATAKNGKTALIYAAEERNTWVAQALLAKDSVRADIKDEEGMTALFYAARAGHEEMARLLLPKKGADIEIETALQLAAGNGDVVLVQLLLDHMYGKSNIDEASKAEKWLATAQLRGAVESGDEEAVSLLLEKGADLEAEDKVGSTALLLAVEAGNEKMVNLLLDNDANMKAKNGFGQTALHLAATGGHLAVAECLLEKKAVLAAIDAIDSNGYTALSSAAYRGDEPILRLLLEKGADANAGELWTALQWAAWFGYKEPVRLLVKNGAHVEAKSFKNRDVQWEGSTALCLAAWNYHMEGGDNLVETVQLLAEMGADVNVTSLDGSTPLHLVALEGHKALIQLLVEKGARIDAKGFEGRTALQCAAERGHRPAVQLLLELGANPVNVEELQRSQGVAQKDFNAAVQAIKEWPGVVSSMA